MVMSSRSLVLFEDSYKKKKGYRVMSGKGTFSEDRWLTSNFFLTFALMNRWH